MMKSLFVNSLFRLTENLFGLDSILFGTAFWLALTFIPDSGAKNLFLVSASIGDGALIGSSDGAKTVGRASYLPQGARVSVRPRSGLETLASGRTLRFGSETIFMIEEKGIVLYEGSLLYRTRKMGALLNIKSPEAEISLDGMGSVMLEVEPNGGLKIVGMLGRVRITDVQSNRATQLLPGELLFVKPGGRGFGDLVYVNLGKMAKTSFLVGGFNNLSSFERSLAVVTKAQDESIAKRFRAVVGDAKGVDTFEVVPVAPDPRPTPVPPPVSVQPSPVRPSSSSNPLEDFLGRPPRRVSPRPDSLLKTPLQPQREIPPAPVPASKHSVPGRLFELP